MLRIFENIGADIRTLPHPTEAREASTIIRVAHAAKKRAKNLTKTVHTCTKHSKYQLHYIHNEQLKTQK